MRAWFANYEFLLVWLGVFSALTFVVSLVVLPVLICRIPVDYFAHGRRHKILPKSHHALSGKVLLAFKNLLGLVLVLLGVAMLVLPGQGLVTILLGITLLNFPGKYRLERWLVGKGPVLQAINWIRRRGGHEPLVLRD